jgi:hypothetical protein
VDLETYRSRYSADSAPGWESIDQRLAEVYADQVPGHFASPIPYALGGADPLDGISIYRCNNGGEAHLHLVTYGFSELYYSEESVGAEFSRFRFELTLRLEASEAERGDPHWALNLLQNIARYVHASKRWFEPFHFIPANGPIKLGSNTNVTALATIRDPVLGRIDTPHGAVEFIQLVGITQDEYECLRDGRADCAAMMREEAKTNPLCITRLNRRPIRPTGANTEERSDDGRSKTPP